MSEVQACIPMEETEFLWLVTVWPKEETASMQLVETHIPKVVLEAVLED